MDFAQEAHRGFTGLITLGHDVRRGLDLGGILGAVLGDLGGGAGIINLDVGGVGLLGGAQGGGVALAQAL